MQIIEFEILEIGETHIKAVTQVDHGIFDKNLVIFTIHRL